MVSFAPDSPPVLMATSAFCLRLRLPTQAFAALDRVLSLNPKDENTWRALLKLLAYGDLRVAREIELRARRAKRIEAWVAALRAQGRLISILEIRPEADWSPKLLERYWQRLVHALTLPELTALANDARRLGQRGDGERLLRRALELAPADIAAREAMIGFLEEGSRREEAEQVAAEGVRLDPRSVQPNLALARVQFGRGRFKQAAETIEALLRYEENNPRVWFEYGQIARYSYDLPLGTEDNAFARAAACAGQDFGVVEMVAQYFLEQLHYAKAAEYYGRLVMQDPHARENPATCRDYARSLKSCGRLDEARDMIASGLNRCRAIAADSAGENLEVVHREEALLLHEARRTDEDLVVLRRVRGAVGASGPNYARPEYLPATPDRLRRLQSIIASRDVVIFLQGPSFLDFAARIGEVNGIDFVAATQGNFPPVEQRLHQGLGRGADLLMVTNPQMVRSWHRELHEFLARPAPNLLLTTYYALSNLQEQGDDFKEFVMQHDERLLFAYPAGGPPLPSRPLHFETCNSLSFFLPLIAIGRPKRIFLVGADGGGHPKFKRPYFFYDDIDAEAPEHDFLNRPDLYSYKNRPDRLDEANRRLRIDALECDRIVVPSFRFLEQLFDIPTPRVFNVCPHSEHRAFPCIDVTTAISMLCERPT